MPLMNGDPFVAVLALYRSHRNGFTEDDLRLVELLAPRVAASLNAAIDVETDDAVAHPAAAPSLKLIRTGSR